MRPVTPPFPPRWKTVFLPGLLLGVLLTLIQVAFFYWGPTLGIPHLLDSFTLMWWMLLLYLVIPALFAFLARCKTGQPALGYRIGRFAGISCAVLLLVTTMVALAYAQANPAPPPPPGPPGLGAGALMNAARGVLFCSSLFLNGVGAILATFGAFLGSRLWKGGMAA